MDNKHKASYGLQIPNVEPQRPKSNPSTGTYHKRGLEIEKVNSTRNSLELVFSKEITSKIDGEKLFMDAFSITPMFRFKMLQDRLIIILDTIKLEKHYIYYLVDLLSKIVSK